MTNRPMKKTSTGHSTSARTSETSTRDTSSMTPAPTSATIDGSTCNIECSMNPTMTRPSTTMHRTSSFGSVIALRSSSDITSATYRSSYLNDLRNSTRASSTNAMKTITTIGAMWTRKSLNVSPARLAMMMFGGSPMSVEAPPMLDASTSAIRYGCAGMRSRLQTTTVTGATSMIVVTLSRNGDATAVMAMSITISRYGLLFERLAAQIARKSNSPVPLMIPTMIIMPSSRKMTFQSIPSCSEKNTPTPG